MARVTPADLRDGYDLVLVGTGFGSAFFLEGYLRGNPRARVAVLEWGAYRDADWQRANQRNTDIVCADTYVGQPGEKPWNYTIGFGGGSNCWWAQTPRLSPNDMRLRSLYGVGEDWPLGYAQLEPYYSDAETIMQVAGPADLARHYPRSRPYAQPPHHLSSADRLLKEAMPDLHYAAPCARLRIPQGARAACCATFRCHLCPVEAKFTVLNTMADIFERENVDLICEARVRRVEASGGVARAVEFESGAREHRVQGEVIAIGANGIQTPFILLQSGFQHRVLGRYLHEKRIVQAEVLLDGLDHFDGGVPISGINLSFMDGPHRREAAAATVYIVNEWRFGLRTEYGRWRQTMPVEFMVEDIPQFENGVFDEGGEFPVVRHGARSGYCNRGVERALEKLPELLSALPVEQISRRSELATGSHVQGTCRMGDDPDASIVDRDLVHHQVRNLLVLGTAVMPSCGPVNPSLTAAALSLRAAARLGGRA